MSLGEMSEREERPAYVSFERRPVEDKAESLKQGRSVSVDVDWILVTPPYSRDIFEQKASVWLEKQKRLVKDGRINPKFLEYWLESYKRWKDGLEPPTNGIDIRNWSLISPAQIKNLLSVGIKTIEDLAQINDEGARRVGMGAIDLKNKANAYLKTADQGALVLENAELKSKTATLEGTVKSLQDQLNLLASKFDTSNAAPVQAVDTPVIEVNDIIEPDNSELESLRTEYFNKFGKKPSHLFGEAGLRKKLAE